MRKVQYSLIVAAVLVVAAIPAAVAISAPIQPRPKPIYRFMVYDKTTGRNITTKSHIYGHIDNNGDGKVAEDETFSFRLENGTSFLVLFPINYAETDVVHYQVHARGYQPEKFQFHANHPEGIHEIWVGLWPRADYLNASVEYIDDTLVRFKVGLPRNSAFGHEPIWNGDMWLTTPRLVFKSTQQLPLSQMEGVTEIFEGPTAFYYAIQLEQALYTQESNIWIVVYELKNEYGGWYEDMKINTTLFESIPEESWDQTTSIFTADYTYNILFQNYSFHVTNTTFPVSFERWYSYVPTGTMNIIYFEGDEYVSQPPERPVWDGNPAIDWEPTWIDAMSFVIIMVVLAIYVYKNRSRS